MGNSEAHSHPHSGPSEINRRVEMFLSVPMGFVFILMSSLFLRHVISG